VQSGDQHIRLFWRLVKVQRKWNQEILFQSAFQAELILLFLLKTSDQFWLAFE
jgi:hypothetical protein